MFLLIARVEYLFKKNTHVSMNTEQFRKYGKDVLDFIGDYRDTVAQRNVIPLVEPGYLKEMLPRSLFFNIWKDKYY